MMLISSECGPGCPPCKDDCWFSYKRFDNSPDNDTLPGVVYRPDMWPHNSLHIADSGHVLAGTRVYNPDGSLRYVTPAPPSGATWLWISFSNSTNTATLFAGKIAIVQEDSTDPSWLWKDVKTVLTIWKWDELTDTTTQIIEQKYLVRHGANPNYLTRDGKRVHLRNVAFPGGFESPISYKLGDVRHGRIVIAGTASWYNEGSNAEYEYNSEIRCWDFDGNQQWTTNLGNFYGTTETIWVFTYWASNPGAHTPLSPYVAEEWDTHNHYVGYPKPLRVRIGKYADTGGVQDKGVYVLSTHSRTPDNYAFKWSPAFSRHEDGPSVQPCFWKISDDVTVGANAAIDWEYYGRPDGTEWDPVIIIENEGGEFVDGDLIPPSLVVQKTSTGFLLTWDQAQGGVSPYTYDVLKNDVVLDANNIFFQFDDVTDVMTDRSYSIRVTDSSDPPQVSFSQDISTDFIVGNAKTASPRDMDIDVLGGAYISLRTSDGYGMVRLESEPSLVSDTSDTSIAGSRQKGFDLIGEYYYPEESPEYAGPATDTGSNGTVAVIRSCPNGNTGLKKVSFGTAGYVSNRRWACGLVGRSQVEIAPTFTDLEEEPPTVTGGHIHTGTGGIAAKEADPPCEVCDCDEEEVPLPDIITACCPETVLSPFLVGHLEGLTVNNDPVSPATVEFGAGYDFSDPNHPQYISHTAIAEWECPSPPLSIEEPVVTRWDFELFCEDRSSEYPEYPGNRWWLELTFTAVGAGGYTITFESPASDPPDSICDPLNLVFQFSEINYCGGGQTIGGLTVTITEPPTPAMPSKYTRKSLERRKLDRLAQTKTPVDLPCVHRGGYMKTLGCCGDVYQCKSKEVFKETGQRGCTINTNTVGLAICSACPHRQPVQTP